MSQQLIFDSDGVSISSAIARFNGTAYQVANIGSVRVGQIRTRRLITVLIFLFGLLLCAAGLASGYLQPGDPAMAVRGRELALTGAAVAIGAVLLQMIWPGWKYILMLKTSGGDVEAFVSRNKDLVLRIQQAIEQAFVARDARA